MRKMNALVSVAVLALVMSMTHSASAKSETVVIDDFDRSLNKIGGRTSIYSKAPSSASADRTTDQHYGSDGNSIKISYNKKGKGGPSDSGGWCGYYSLLKRGSKYFDGSSFTNLTFYVKGEKGGENFKIGMSDRHWDSIGDSVKSDDVGMYLPEGKVTRNWQKATIPLDIYHIDHYELAAISIAFEADCFPNGAGNGIVYIDSAAFEK